MMTRPQLYTVFLDYKGGTYISQVRSLNPAAGLGQWCRQLAPEDLTEWSLDRSQLARIVAEDPVPLQDRIGVWCLSGVDDHNEQVLLNIVATDDAERT